MAPCLRMGAALVENGDSLPSTHRGLIFTAKHPHSQLPTTPAPGHRDTFLWPEGTHLYSHMDIPSPNIHTYYVYGTHTFTESAISCTPLAAASLMTGVIKPLSVATATEMSTEGSCFGPSPSQRTLTPGICCKQKNNMP